jgi:hypothetical protein
MTTTDEKSGSSWLALILGWTAVGIPLAWGVAQTIKRALAIFGARL